MATKHTAASRSTKKYEHPRADSPAPGHGIEGGETQAASDPLDPAAEARRQARQRREHQQALAASTGQELWTEDDPQPEPTTANIGALCLELLEAEEARVGVEADVRDNRTGPGALKEAVKRESRAHARLHAVYLDFKAQGEDDEATETETGEMSDSTPGADGSHAPATRHDG